MKVYRQDVKSGLFILAAVLLLFLGLFRAGGYWEAMNSGKAVNMTFDDAQQITVGADVLFRGKKVGRVADVRLAGDGSHVVVVADIQLATPLQKGMQAQIIDKSMLGGKSVQLLPPDLAQGQTPEPLPEGAVIPGMSSGGLSQVLAGMSSMMENLDGKIGSLTEKSETLLVNMNQTVSEARQQLRVVGELKPQMQELMSTYTTLGRDLNNKVEGLSLRLTQALDRVLPPLEQTSDKLQAMIADLRTDTRNVTTRLDVVLQRSQRLVENLDGQLGAYHGDLTASLAAMNRTMTNLEIFSEKIAGKPNALILGGGQDEPMNEAGEEALFLQELSNYGLAPRRGMKE